MLPDIKYRCWYFFCAIGFRARPNSPQGNSNLVHFSWHPKRRAQKCSFCTRNTKNFPKIRFFNLKKLKKNWRWELLLSNFCTNRDWDYTRGLEGLPCLEDVDGASSKDFQDFFKELIQRHQQRDSLKELIREVVREVLHEEPHSEKEEDEDFYEYYWWNIGKGKCKGKGKGGRWEWRSCKPGKDER